MRTKVTGPLPIDVPRAALIAVGVFILLDVFATITLPDRDADEAELVQIKSLHEYVDRTHRIVLGYVVVQ